MHKRNQEPQLVICHLNSYFGMFIKKEGDDYQPTYDGKIVTIPELIQMLADAVGESYETIDDFYFNRKQPTHELALRIQSALETDAYIFSLGNQEDLEEEIEWTKPYQFELITEE